MANLLGLKFNGLGIVVAIASALYAGRQFVKDHRRPPSRSETRSLVIYSLISSMVLSLAATLGVIFTLGGPRGLAYVLNDTRLLIAKITLPIAIVSATVITLIYYLVLSLSYGWLTRKTAARHLPILPERREPELRL